MSRQRRAAPHSRMLRLAAPLMTGMLVLALASAAPATADSSPDLSVSPSKGLPVTGAEITVRGSNFDTHGDVWIAVCQDDGVAPASFAHCLGGAIPDDNATSGWAVISKDGKARYAGPVVGKFSKKGGFTVTLQIPVATGQDADCLAEKCAVYSRSANPDDRSQDARAKVSFSFSGSGSSGGSAPSTEVIGSAPATVQPDSVLQPTASAGSDQVVVFSGFTPGEVVDSTLYSDPIPLPPVQADPSGKVTIAFTVPPDLPAGTHLVQAIGRQSDRVGVAQFEVTAADATTTDPTATTATTQTTPSSLTQTSDTAAVLAPPATETSDATTTENTAASAVAAAVSSVPAASGASSGAARLIWLWVVLGAIVVIGGAAALVVMLRRRRQAEEYDDMPAAQPVDVAEPSWQGVRIPAADAGEPSEEPFVPLAGSDAGDAGPATERWSPLSGADAEPGGDARVGATSGDAVADPGPATEQWSPAFFDGAPAAPVNAGDGIDGDEPSSSAGRHRSL